MFVLAVQSTECFSQSIYISIYPKLQNDAAIIINNIHIVYTV